VQIEFHRPLTIDEAGGRKQLAAVAERAVRAGLVRALHGSATHLPEDEGAVEAFADGEKEAEAA
jgi:hypothetical protein